MSDERPSPPQKEDGDQFVIDFIKSQFFRVVFAEGFWGGTTIEDNIHISFWNSRDAIPKSVTYKLDENGEVINIDQSIRADQVREVEVGVIMGIETAKALRNLLDEMITNAQESEANDDANERSEPTH